MEALRWAGLAMQAEGRTMAEHGRVMAEEAELMMARHGLPGPTADDLRAAGYRAATIVLVSDGQSTCDPPCEVAEQLAERMGDLRLVVDDRDVSLARHEGSQILNAAPPSSPAIGITSPPHASAFFLAIDSPSPVPSPGALVV